MRPWLLVSLLYCVSTAHGNESALDALEVQIESSRSEHKVPAVGVLLVDKHGMLFSKVWGTADVTSKRPANKQTIFRIGSVTKAFTGLTFLALNQKNLLPLDHVLSNGDRPLPFQNPWQKTQPITVEMLLEHTAGLADMTSPEWDHADQKPLTLQEAFAIDPKSRRMRWQPGKHSSYTNTGAGLAAWAAEQQLQKPFEELMQEFVFSPLGMKSATLFLTKDVEQHLATGYQADGKTVIPYWNMIYRPFGAMNIRLDDMEPFLRLLLNRGEHNGNSLLSKQSVERMEVPHTTLAARSGLEYGYGFGNYQWYRNGLLFHGHGGDGDGYLAHYGYNLDTNLGYFVVINAFNHRPLREMRDTLERFIVGGKKTPIPVEAFELKRDRRESLLGDYTQVTQRFVGRGRVTFHGHAEEGVRMYRRGPARRIGFPADVGARVEQLILYHLRPGQYDGSWSDSAVRRFVREVGPGMQDLLD
ncbi:MAG: serine hydrolase domain-containing protein, partial [Pseudomonadota bacterium]